MPYNVNTASVNATNLLYKVIADTVISAYRKSTPLLDILTKPDRKGANANGNKGFFDRFQNNYMYLDVIDQPIFATATGTSAKIQSGTSNPAQFSVQCLPLYSSVQYENFAEIITSSDKGAIKKMSQVIIGQMTGGFKRTLNRMAWGNGSGQLAVTGGATTASTSVTVTNDADRLGTMYFTKNMTVSFAGATGGSINATTTSILSVNTGTQTLTLKDPMSIPAAAVVTSASPDGSGVNEITGIQNLVASGLITVQGVNLTLLNQSLPHISTNATESFSPTHMNTLRNTCQIEKPTAYFANNTVYTEVGMFNTTNERTWMGEKADLDVGFEHVTAHQGTVKVYLDYDTPYGKLYMLNTDALTLGILRDVYMLPGSLMRLPQYAINEVVMGWAGNLGCSIFDAQALYTNLQ